MGHYGLGTAAPWYEPQRLSDAERLQFRDTARRSAAAKRDALAGLTQPKHPINAPRLDPDGLMPQLPRNGLRALSLFSGGGGLDLGFDRAGYDHVASFEIIGDAAETLRANRPAWEVFDGAGGDVENVDWSRIGIVADVIHAGPPCQPFSVAGRQRGAADSRNLFPAFVKAVKAVKPLAFVAENVRAITGRMFKEFVQRQIIKPVADDYRIDSFVLYASEFGVPQIRARAFFVGIRRDVATCYCPPAPTHGRESTGLLLFSSDSDSGPVERCMGTREALGLPDIGYDALAPTLRSGLTGPRHTTSILSSVSALRAWHRLGIWPNGVARNRQLASRYVPDNGHFRLSVEDCALLQGFPSGWTFYGPVYKAIGQIGNSVAPPMAYRVALSIARALASAAEASPARSLASSRSA